MNISKYSHESVSVSRVERTQQRDQDSVWWLRLGQGCCRLELGQRSLEAYNSGARGRLGHPAARGFPKPGRLARFWVLSAE